MENFENPENSTEGSLSGVTRQSVLVINCGSSSVKFALIETETEEPLMTGLVERLNTEEAELSWKIDGEKLSKALPGADLVAGLKEVISILPKEIEVMAIGHRVVHGAEEFASSFLVTDQILEVLERCSPLAPLHNPANIAGIRAAQEVFSDKPQVAVFDTAFHQTIPEHAYLYAVPYDWYKDLRVRRYGFHGTSHRYVAGETARILGKDLSDLSVVIAHLGNGCSACAVENGQSADTTMGLSPLEGLVMGTRSGDVDPALHEYLSNNLGWDLERIMKALNKESGLLGLSGQSNDMRTLVTGWENGDDRATLAIEVFAYRLAKSIMGLTAALSKLDAIVFTGGIGENSYKVRAKTMSHLRVLGVQIDDALNAQNGDAGSGRITQPDSLPCLVVPTNEELMIARETLSLTK
ncbi:MAG: acetate/propionate family kinase [Puniceicoccaceae bacterium]